jgi:hypothetical protein
MSPAAEPTVDRVDFQVAAGGLVTEAIGHFNDGNTRFLFAYDPGESDFSVGHLIGLTRHGVLGTRGVNRSVGGQHPHIAVTRGIQPMSPYLMQRYHARSGAASMRPPGVEGLSPSHRWSSASFG